jgi:hypothetical protein
MSSGDEFISKKKVSQPTLLGKRAKKAQDNNNFEVDTPNKR